MIPDEKGGLQKNVSTHFSQIYAKSSFFYVYTIKSSIFINFSIDFMESLEYNRMAIQIKIGKSMVMR